MSDNESGDDSGSSSTASVISVVPHVSTSAINNVAKPDDEPNIAGAAVECCGTTTESLSSATQDEVNPDPDIHSTGTVPETVENSNVIVGTVAENEENSNLSVCWVCYGTEADSPNAEWVNPCRCRGTTKWVHHVCLMRWIDEKQRGQSHTKVACPQCNTEYVIFFPPLGFFCEGLQLLDRFIFKSSPVMATGVALTSLYWSATTYGAISLMQILGHKEGLDLMERTDPLFLLVGLPTIPVIMVCGKLLPWDDYLLKLWRKYAFRIPILNYILSLDDPSRYRSSLTPQDTQPVREIKFTRVFCGAMLFPTVAALVGKFAYRNVHGNFRRSLLGGITFVVVKGILKIYLQQKIYNLSGLRKVAEFKQDTVVQASSSAIQPRVGPVEDEEVQPPPN